MFKNSQKYINEIKEEEVIFIFYYKSMYNHIMI